MAVGSSPKRVWGSHEHKLDAKGRLSIPNKFRVVLGLEENDVLVVTRDAASKSLLVFWLDAWRRFEEKAELLSSKREELALKRILEGELEAPSEEEEAAEDLMRQYHHEVKLDGLGRIQIPAMLRSFAGLKGGDPCRVLGKGGAIGVWAHEEASRAHSESRFARQKGRVGFMLSPGALPAAASSDDGGGSEA